MAERKKKANLIVWAVLGLLVFALGGFGIGNFGGTVRSIGSVGDAEIPTTDYALALQNALRARQSQTGTAPSLASPEGQAIASQVRRQLIGAAAVEGESDRLGLSTGDARVRDAVTGSGNFTGLDGSFDRAAYADALRRAGISEAAYETRVRNEAASNLVMAAILSGAPAHPAQIAAIAAYAGERRDILWLKLDASSLEEPLPEPDAAALKAQYDDNPESYTAPERKALTYVWLTPEMAVDEIEVDEAELRALYDERSEEFNQPERRLVERLVFPDAEAAAAARAALDDGGSTFEALVQGRGLTLTDVDLGDVSRADLGSAAEPVFALTGPGIAGPVETDLGPALFRVNAILSAQETPFEEVRESLVDELALERARRSIAERREGIDDLLAGGATLEEVAEETDMELGSLELGPEDTDGIAGYPAFRAAAEELQEGDFPELREFKDGGLFALRLDAVMPPALLEFADVEARVREDWRIAETQRRLSARAEEIRAARAAGQSLSDQSLSAQAKTGLARDSFLDGAPESLIEEVFALDEPGAIAVVPGDGAVHLAELTAVTPLGDASVEAGALRDAIAQSISQAQAQDALDLFVQALEAEAGLSLNQTAIDAVHAQFP